MHDLQIESLEKKLEEMTGKPIEQIYAELEANEVAKDTKEQVKNAYHQWRAAKLKNSFGVF